MNGFQITCIVVLVSVATFFALRRTIPTTSTVKPAALQPGPIRHTQLPDALVARVRAFESVFAEVDPSTHEKWIEDFQRDRDPEKEIAIWEHIAAAFSQFTAGRNLPLEVRREAFGVLLVRSSSTDEKMLYSKLKYLTLEDAKKLVSLYSAPAKPIEVEKR